MTDISDAPELDPEPVPTPKPTPVAPFGVVGADELPDDVKNGEVPGPDSDDGSVTHEEGD